MKSILIVFTGFAAALVATAQTDKRATAIPSAQLNDTAFKADIRVDTNRDGAIFLANIGDSGGRCKKLHPDTSPSRLAKILETLAKCHDADDDKQRAPGNLAPTRTMPIQGLSNSATGTVSVSDTKARSLVRIFRAGKDDSWEIVDNDTAFSAQELQQGLTLGIDARDTRRPDGWDGRVTVDFSVKDGGVVSKDSVVLRVAPVLLHHHHQPIQKVFTSNFLSFPTSFLDYIDDIISRVEDGMQRALVPGPITRLRTKDPWAQDYFEPAYTSMPGPNGTIVSLRVIIEGKHNPKRNSTALVYTSLRGDNVGGIASHPRPRLDKIESTYSAGGNMEAIPPYELNDVKFPAGRVIMGGDESNKPESLDFFKVQEVQAPLILDSNWLSVRHVDEILQAVPTKTERGWGIMAIDPLMGLELLRTAEEGGFGDQPLIDPYVARSGPSISAFLKESSNIQAAEKSGARMKANLELLKKETGITGAEIFRVPALISLRTVIKGYSRLVNK